MEMTDTVVQKGKWVFNEEVVSVFDDMLIRSIPQYEVMRDAVFSIGQNFVQPKTQIVDLGCSKGEALAPFYHKYGAHNQYIGIEISDPMFQASKERFQGAIDCGVMTLTQDDLRHKLPLRVQDASLVLSVLTLQFIPIEYRQALVKDCYDRLTRGGAFRCRSYAHG